MFLWRALILATKIRLFEQPAHHLAIPPSPMTDLAPASTSDEKPPILGNWQNFYWLVLATLVCYILTFYLFSAYFKA
ncbi:hypothetical protein [Hugenholtzia roseola]|uniref:hypothetical protein n=1 Tax=Hugenholtzia roseola TaxID=1002 RepID=UPI0003FA0C59|nr:hypothetical protein [Hugenholtzia roseola]